LITTISDWIVSPFESLNCVLFGGSFDEARHKRRMERLHRRIAKEDAKIWAKETGASASEQKANEEARFNLRSDPVKMDAHFSSINEFHKGANASPEAKKAYLDLMTKKRTYGTMIEDYASLTRNEFKKKYPHINSDNTNGTKSSRPSLARIVNGIRGHRMTSQAERRAFSQQQYKVMGLQELEAKYRILRTKKAEKPPEKSRLANFVAFQKEHWEFSRNVIENFSPELIKDPNKAIRDAEKSIKISQKNIANIKQMQLTGNDTTLRIFEQDLQKLPPQQRKEIEAFLSMENRIKIMQESIKADNRIIAEAYAKINLSTKHNKQIFKG